MNARAEETVPCQFCGIPTRMTGTKMCDGCYEVNGRLDRFVRTAAGRARVAQAIETAFAVARNQERDAACRILESTDDGSAKTERVLADCARQIRDRRVTVDGEVPW